MQDTNSMTIHKKGAFVDPQALQQMEGLSNKLIKSQALPNTIQNASQLMMVFLAGYDAGMTPMQAIQSYYFVNGKLTIWGAAVITQLKNAGWKIEWLESTDKKAHVRITKGDEVGEDEFTYAEAKKAGLTGKGPWQKYPKDMLRWKAIGRCIRFTCPEVLSGVYIKEDIEHDIVDVKANVRTVEQDTEPADLEPITNEQKAHIEHLADAIGTPMKEIEKWVMDRYGCEVRHLTYERAKSIVSALEKRVEMDKVGEAKEQEDQPSDDDSEGTQAEVIDGEFEEKQPGVIEEPTNNETAPPPIDPNPGRDITDEEMADVLGEPAPSADDIVKDLPPDLGGGGGMSAKEKMMASMPPEQRKTFTKLGAGAQ